jgi:hypothetical protein
VIQPLHIALAAMDMELVGRVRLTQPPAKGHNQPAEADTMIGFTAWTTSRTASRTYCGDMCGSRMRALEALYPSLSARGYVISQWGLSDRNCLSVDCPSPPVGEDLTPGDRTRCKRCRVRAGGGCLPPVANRLPTISRVQADG